MRARLVVIALLLLVSWGGSAGDKAYSPVPRARFADATSDICLANCSSKLASCKRVCPSTFGIACQNACDSQAVTCREGCRPR